MARLSHSFLLLGILVAAALGDSDMDAVSIFNLPLGSDTTGYTFAINIPEDSKDVYFHLSGPSAYSWVAVGTGREMKDSLMILLYSDATGKNVTVSPRLCTGEKEPVFEPSLAVEILAGTGISNGRLTVNARCSNCTSWATGSLDLHSASQPWLYALGPRSGANAVLRSDSKAASIERHSIYGQFSIDMTQATGGPGSLPDSYTTSTGSTPDGGPRTDSNWPSIIHGLALCAAFVLFMPTGVIFLRVAPQSVLWHWINQSLAAILAILGVLVGFYLSTMFTKSQSFTSPHQILGIIITVAVLAQWLLGFWHHRLYNRTRAPTWYGVVHRYFGQVVIFLAVVNGGIGLTWSYASTAAVVGYSVVVAGIGLGVIGALVWKQWSARKGGYVHQPARLNESAVDLNEYPRG